MADSIGQRIARSSFIIGVPRSALLIGASLLASVSACADLDEDLNGLATMQVKVPLNVDVSRLLGSCEGLVLERHRYVNGPGSLLNATTGKTSDSGLNEYTIQPDITDYLKVQSKSNLCWATSLEIAFKYKGYNYAEREFINILKDNCSSGENPPATLREILFSASTRHVGSPSWPALKNAESYSDENRNASIDLSWLPFHFYYYCSDSSGTTSIDTRKLRFDTFTRTYYNAYSEVSWHKRSDRSASLGGIMHASNTGSMVYYLLNDTPLLVGLRDRGGHAVIIYGAEYRMGGIDKRQSGGQIVLDGRTKIEGFYVMDPYDDGTGQHFYIQDADELLSDADFIYALDIR